MTVIAELRGHGPADHRCMTKIADLIVRYDQTVAEFFPALPMSQRDDACRRFLELIARLLNEIAMPAGETGGRT